MEAAIAKAKATQDSTANFEPANLPTTMPAVTFYSDEDEAEYAEDDQEWMATEQGVAAALASAAWQAAAEKRVAERESKAKRAKGEGCAARAVFAKPIAGSSGAAAKVAPTKEQGESGLDGGAAKAPCDVADAAGEKHSSVTAAATDRRSNAAAVAKDLDPHVAAVDRISNAAGEAKKTPSCAAEATTTVQQNHLCSDTPSTFRHIPGTAPSDPLPAAEPPRKTRPKVFPPPPPLPPGVTNVRQPGGLR